MLCDGKSSHCVWQGKKKVESYVLKINHCLKINQFKNKSLFKNISV